MRPVSPHCSKDYDRARLTPPQIRKYTHGSTAMNAASEYPQPYAICVDEFLRMGEAGIFAPHARLELIEGGILEMAPIGSPHAGAVNLLTELFVQRAQGRATVAIQNPFIADKFSMPQPDLLLLKPRADRYSKSHPMPADILLLIEVADLTLRFDLRRKVPLYAQRSVCEVWIVDLNDCVVRVFRELKNGEYRETFAASCSALPGDTVAPVAFPQIEINVAEIFLSS